MPDFDAIVIGAGHNGLTAAAVMARGGMRVLCVEKNHFIGGMASTTELIRGYRFELAGSIQFPVPNEVFEDLDLGSCPIYEPEVQSASIGNGDQPPLFLYSDPERLLEHLGEALGIEAVLGMAEVAAWAEAPARAIGRFDVRRGPRSLDEMWDCATNETEREALRVALFGSVMDVIDRYLPDKSRACPGPQHAQLSLRQLDLPRARHSGQRAVSCLRPGLTGHSHDVEGAGRLGHHGGSPVRHVRAQRRRAAPPRQGHEDRRARGAVRGVELGDRSVVTAPVVVSNLDPTATFVNLIDSESLPDAFARRVAAIDHRAAYFQAHFALSGLPEYRSPYEELNGTTFGRNVTFFGTAEEMQADFEGCVRGLVPRSPSFNLQIPSLDDPSLAPEGMHTASSFAFYSAGRNRPGVTEPAARRHGRAHRRQDHRGGTQLPRPDRPPTQLPGLHL